MLQYSRYGERIHRGRREIDSSMDFDDHWEYQRLFGDDGSQHEVVEDPF